MWEGTGEYGSSRLQYTDMATGKSCVVAKLPNDHFGEGITLLGDKIYQLTWQNHIMHIYDRTTYRKLATKTYKGEGWGLTTDGQMLYMSDGTPDIRVLDPATLEVKRRIAVTCNGESLPYLNELEWIEGKIWANVYTLDQIVVINPESGVVEKIVNLRGLLPQSEVTATTDVLNGIAYDEENKRIFVTGKNWSKMFEIRVL
jgi:glutamine cyclotransferase